MLENPPVVMSDKLEPIIANLLRLLQEKKYSEHTIKQYGKVLSSLIEYTAEHEVQEFTAEYCNAFSAEKYGGLQERDSAAFRADQVLRRLIDFIRVGTVIPHNNNRAKWFNESFKLLFEGFLDTQRERGLAVGSLNAIRSHLFRLESFLIDSGAACFAELTLEMVNAYILTFIDRSTTMSSTALREFGRLSDYALKNGFHSRSFSNVIPHVKNLRRQRLPQIFTMEETEKILSVVDRNNPRGKRDYAMLMFAARLGIRTGDIRKMPVSAIDWTKKTLSFSQSKTGKWLELPLPDDVGWAIIDYMKNGRPASKSPNIFASHRYPYNELDGAYNNIVAQYMRKAGIYTPQNKGCGMHSLRHSLASAMLREGVSLTDISGVLGHADIHSTETYLRVAEVDLRKCPLEVDW
jgi:site-specific recombinase XerD